MTDPAAFVGSIPDYYDRGLGPCLFADYAADLARSVAATAPGRVLEIAAGTGIVTRKLRDALPRASDLIASDLNLPMLDVAREKFTAGENVELRATDASTLPFDDRSFDAVACQFGVMFFPDKMRAYREASRVLAAGGWYHFNVWDSFEFNPFARLTHEIIGRHFERDAPSFYRVPFAYHDVDAIKTSLHEAGFTKITARVHKIRKTIPSALHFAQGLVFGNPVIDEIRGRGAVDPEAIVRDLAAGLNRLFGDDPGTMPLQAIVFSARKPG